MSARFQSWLTRPSRHPVLLVVILLTVYALLPAIADAAVSILEALK